MMEKKAAIAELNRRGASPRLGMTQVRFANVNASKAVWWLDLPLDDVLNERDPAINLVLAGSGSEVFHLRAPKAWMIENIEEFAVREDKDVISLELSCERHNLFQDVRPKSGRLHLARFRVG